MGLIVILFICFEFACFRGCNGVYGFASGLCGASGCVEFVMRVCACVGLWGYSWITIA